MVLHQYITGLTMLEYEIYCYLVGGMVEVGTG